MVTPYRSDAPVPVAPPTDPDVHVGATGSTTEVEDEVRHLSDTLSSLLARDGDDPPLWWSSTFARRVASARSVMASVPSTARLAAGFERPGRASDGAVGGFQADARRLARDAITVAIAIRWSEIRHGTALPPWPELLRRRSLAPVTTDREAEAARWFG